MIRMETDRRTNGTDCITFLTNAVGNKEPFTYYITREAWGRVVYNYDSDYHSYIEV